MWAWSETSPQTNYTMRKEKNEGEKEGEECMRRPLLQLHIMKINLKKYFIVRPTPYLAYSNSVFLSIFNNPGGQYNILINTTPGWINARKVHQEPLILKSTKNCTAFSDF